ncbi:MAG TPA: hypothetical protein VIM53_02205 [Candidatus Saccharimonadales bacterium]
MTKSSEAFINSSEVQKAMKLRGRAAIIKFAGASVLFSGLMTGATIGIAAAASHEKLDAAFETAESIATAFVLGGTITLVRGDALRQEAEAMIAPLMQDGVTLAVVPSPSEQMPGTQMDPWK